MSVHIPHPKELYNQALTTPWTVEDAEAVRRVFYSSAREKESLTDDDVDRCLIAAIRQYMRHGYLEFSIVQHSATHAELVSRWRAAGYPVWSTTELSFWSKLIRLMFMDCVLFDLDPPRFL